MRIRRQQRKILQFCAVAFNSLTALHALGKILKKRKRSCCVRRINQDRFTRGFFNATFSIMKEIDTPQFFIQTRMTPSTFELLLNLTKSSLQKFSIREPLSPEFRLALTLSFLSEITSVQGVAWKFKVGKETARKIIIETCEVIWRTLMVGYVAEPNSTDFEEIAQGFWSTWNLPNCIGAIDGKHIAIVKPANSVAQYYNYKHFCSVVLMAACDHKYRFTYVDIGAYGSQSDGGVFRASKFGQRILQHRLQLPPPTPLPGETQDFPFYFAADAAFPMHKHILKPYGGKNLTQEHEYYNKRFSRARRIIENSFGILVNRWRILHTTLPFKPANI